VTKAIEKGEESQEEEVVTVLYRQAEKALLIRCHLSKDLKRRGREPYWYWWDRSADRGEVSTEALNGNTLGIFKVKQSQCG
jgi:hypothetical protein